MLNNRRRHVAWRADGRKTNKDRVIAIFPRDFIGPAQSVLALVLADPADLRGPRLTAQARPGSVMRSGKAVPPGSSTTAIILSRTIAITRVDAETGGVGSGRVAD